MNRRCACLRVCAATLCVGLLAAGTLRAAPADDDWDPPAIRVRPTSSHETRPIDELIEEGRRLFVTAFNRHDGAGRPAATGDVKPTRRLAIATGFDRLSGPDASACVGCHNQPRAGGHGDYASTVFVASATRYAVATPDQGNAQALRRPPSLFGAGLLELLAREMTRDLIDQRDGALARARAAGRDVSIDLSAKGVRFGSLVARPDGSYDAAGLSGVDPDLVVRPFGWRGQAVSVREFTITALNQHHGIEAVERFGWERTGQRDFDEDGVETEFTPAQVSRLALFVASLPAPRPARRATESAQLDRGRNAFARAGCAGCHRPELTLADPIFTEPSPYNPPGTMRPQDLGTVFSLPLVADAGPVQVAAYTDLKRHLICDETDPFLCNEVSTRDGRPTGEFLTADLWGVGQGPPYMHHGGCATLSEAIRHHAGEATSARRAFLGLPDAAKRDLIAYLLSLGASDDPSDNRDADGVAGR